MSKLHTALSESSLYLHVNYMAIDLYAINTIISVGINFVQHESSYIKLSVAYSERHTLKHSIHSPIKTSTEIWLAGNKI
jgi:hypothetical protein